MERLLLARHAFAGSNRDLTASCAVPGEGLTPEGVAQARRLGDELIDEGLDLGASSELARARETLEIALAGRDVPLLVVPELNEIGFGSYDGGLLAAYREWAAACAPDEVPAGDGESRALAAARFARGLRVLLARTEPVVLLVAHALIVRYVLDAARGLVPAPLMAPVEHAVAHRLEADEVASAATLLEQWSERPRFRDPSLDA